MNILLFIQLVVDALLILVIMLQRTNVDGVGTLVGNNMGLMNVVSANSFLAKTTRILAAAFILNSLLLANISSHYNKKRITLDTSISTVPHNENAGNVDRGESPNTTDTKETK